MVRVPMYEVIYRDLDRQISRGTLKPGDRLPSEGEIADHYGVSRMTVRQAVGRLTDERRLVRRRGAGTFVSDRPTTPRKVHALGPFSEEIGRDDTAIATRVHAQQVAEPPEQVTDRLGIKPRQKVIRVLRVRLVEDRPAAIQDSWIPYALAPALAQEELLGGSLYRTLADRFGIRLTWAEQEVSAAAASSEQAALLQVHPGAPLIAITRLTHSDGDGPVEFAQSWTRPEFPLFIRLER
ncbi:GntR family transcriptional regulator [Streptomyces sp. NBC_00582]|uniref:GntR family transcriptional regulator n=1 Tax=Streptomyces sp. NBC_00582 TaxID=2975783 RepID=UPI0010629257|nr:GntR family transcriptional regulator [Streptomyces sp. NBC_00582]WUB59654.1 GntR family transcriptional regulator [Streptomyces sp. NBC_00582]